MMGKLERIGSLLRRIGQRSRSRRQSRPAAALRPEVTGLEDRTLQFVTSISAVAIPNILVPPNGRYVPVTVAGVIHETGDAAPNAFFRVTDQYRRDEPFAHIDLLHVARSTFAFEFTTHLQAKRSTQFPVGRHYYILVAAGDTDNGTGKTIPVLVPLNPARPPAPAPAPVHGRSVPAPHTAVHPAGPRLHRA